MMPPTSIDGTDITGATIDGTDVQEITVDGDTVFTAVSISGKAAHRFKLDEGSGTSISDSIGSLSGTLTSPFWVSGTFQGGTAIQGDGSSDTAEINSALPALTNNLSNGFALAVTVKNPTSSPGRILMGFDFTRLIRLASNGRFELRDDSQARALVEGPNLQDGVKRRWLINGQDGDPNNWEIFVDGVAQTTNVLDGSTVSNFVLTSNVFLLSNSVGGDFSKATIDDLIIYDEELTNSEIQDDFDVQP